MLGFREKVDLERSEIVKAEVESLQVGEVAQAWDLIIQNSENGAVIGFQGEREREREMVHQRVLCNWAWEMWQSWGRWFCFPSRPAPSSTESWFIGLVPWLSSWTTNARTLARLVCYNVSIWRWFGFGFSSQAKKQACILGKNKIWFFFFPNSCNFFKKYFIGQKKESQMWLLHPTYLNSTHQSIGSSAQ